MSVFFLISGFLLYRPFALSHLSERNAPSIKHFWQRRFLRIVPAYWLALTVLTYVFGIITVGPGWQGFAMHYFFLQIYFPTGVFNGITQAWSLCTEVSFYLFLPLYQAVVGLRRRGPRRQLVVELCGCARADNHKLHVSGGGSFTCRSSPSGMGSSSLFARRTA